MLSTLVPRMFSHLWIQLLCISCVCLMTDASINNTAMHQSCQDLECENSNACHASLGNGTMASLVYCSCRGEWAGFKCEIKVYLKVQILTTEKIALEIQGYITTRRIKKVKFEDLHISDATVALWNFNISDQCLLMRKQSTTGKVIILDGLDKNQEYLACFTNGFVDSCSFFQVGLLKKSTSSNCLYFKTKFFNESPIDIGLIIVPCAVLVIISLLFALFYRERHSVLVQLFLKKVCCRSSCTKHLQKQLCLKPKWRHNVRDALMSTDYPAGMETASDVQTPGTGDSSHGRTFSSNASSSTSQRSAYSPDPDGSVLMETSPDHTTFLYEDQSLITPLYSPQDHKVMTLTFIDEDILPKNKHNFSSDDKDLIYSGPCLQNITRDDKFIIEKLAGCHSIQQTRNIPRQHEPIGEHYFSPGSTLSQETFSAPQATGHLKQYLSHSYFNGPHDKNPFIQHQLLSSQPRRRFSYLDHSVTFREPDFPRRPKRPQSLSFTVRPKDSSQTTSLPERDVLNHSHDGSSSAWAWANVNPTRDSYIKSSSDRNHENMTHFLTSPTRYSGILKENIQGNIASPFNHADHNGHTSSTLPRRSKTRFVSAFLVKNMQEFSLGYNHGSEKTPEPTKPPQKPTWLDLPIRTQDMFAGSQSQSITPAFLDTASLSSSESKSYNKHSKSFKNHLENNLSFLKPSKTNKSTNEEQEFRDLQSPLAEERSKSSKKSRSSSFSRALFGASTPSKEISRHSVSPGLPIFEGHPSEHILPPFSAENNDGEDDLNESSILNEVSDQNSSASHISKSSAISSFDDDDTNLVTPFVTEDSSDDDTYKDIQSLSGSTGTLHDDNLETGQSMLNYETFSEMEHLVFRRSQELNFQSEESEQLIEYK